MGGDFAISNPDQLSRLVTAVCVVAIEDLLSLMRQELEDLSSIEALDLLLISGGTSIST